ncbi:MAG: 50S ribosomal protein L4 [Nitrososphaeraceae archaeon]
MKAKISEIDGLETGEIELPVVFNTPIREDIIHKSYVNLLSHNFQRQGRYPMAGEVVSAESRNTGQGIARIARARGEGFPRAGQAAGVAGVRHGRVAHPPESWKNTYKKINKKEKKYGLCSSIAATCNKDLVERRGHKLGKIISLPLVVSNNIESLVKTKDLKKALVSLGIGDDLQRVENSVKNTSGTRRLRGRKSRSGKSVLIIVDENKKILDLSGSVRGVDVASVTDISVLDMAPGSRPARLTIYSVNAIEKLRGLKLPLDHKIEVPSNT